MILIFTDYLQYFNPLPYSDSSIFLSECYHSYNELDYVFIMYLTMKRFYIVNFIINTNIKFLDI